MPQTKENKVVWNLPDQNSRSSEQKKLPVFVSPDKFEFVTTDQSTHKQILTIYNPYDFPIHFKVLCTAPKNYIVGDPKGIIKRKSCKDTLIRRVHLEESERNTVDRFRIEVSDIQPSSRHHQKFETSPLGAKEILSVLVETLSQSTSTAADSRPSEVVQSDQLVILQKDKTGELLSGKWILVSIAVVCLLALTTHTAGQEDPQSFIPTYLSLTASQKMVASYVLGLVTMAIFQH